MIYLLWKTWIAGYTKVSVASSSLQVQQRGNPGKSKFHVK